LRILLPLSGEIVDQEARFWVRQHAPYLGFENARLAQRFLFRRG
jgi:hypothetical protein